ncbi:hypothetical protein CDAR_184781 [Caerostris darwini]|uniref:Uncharacterized protein n=1 Tax=Caerostris darwini TaxID=1538125 RepID=A0AAV4SVI5_9ARAC|nr:hypothetical protein CDAR_184781 [Caerostris darwini]
MRYASLYGSENNMEQVCHAATCHKVIRSAETYPSSISEYGRKKKSVPLNCQYPLCPVLALSYLHCPWQIKAAVVLQPYWSSRGLSTSSSIAGTSAIHLLQPLFPKDCILITPLILLWGNFGFHVLYKLEMRHRWPKKITSD